MTCFETAHITAAYRDRCQDCVTVIDDGDRTLIVVADGAGGVGHGDLAAATVIRTVQSVYPRIETAEQWSTELKQIDCQIGAGESTAVIVDLRPDGICGASVGDSRAWNIYEGNITDLTAHQNRKPLLGSRLASPVGFNHPPLVGMLMVATDGFCDYVKRQELPRVIVQTDFFAIPRTCVEMVRLPSGDLWDDIGIVACRPRPLRRSRKRYVIG